MFDGVLLRSLDGVHGVDAGLLGAEAGPITRVRHRLRERHGSDRACAMARRKSLLAWHEAQLSSERAQLAREVHDVLAHTLGAVSVQLTSLDCRLAAGDAPDEIRDRVAHLHRLVGDGLDEAADAVRNLRQEGIPLAARLMRLCDLSEATLEVHGEPRALTPDATLALYRAAQEALTNATKHAPGATTRIALRFEGARVRMRVDNDQGDSASPGPLATSGGRHGLIGMRERVEHLGGRLDVGPTADGWRVLVELSACAGPTATRRVS